MAIQSTQSNSNLSKARAFIRENPVDTLQDKALEAGFQVGGHIGRTAIGVAMFLGAGAATLDQVKDAGTSLSDMVKEFGPDQARAGVGDALWNTIPDLTEAAGHLLVAAMFGYVTVKTVDNYLEALEKDRCSKVG